MNQFNEYKTQLAIRASDKIALVAATKREYGDPVVSSDTWETAKERFETGSKVLKAAAAGAALGRRGEAAGVAAAGAALMDLGADIAKQKAEAARAQEKAANERRALERQMKESVERGMREHQERMGRGEYRDPPTREQQERIGRIA